MSFLEAFLNTKKNRDNELIDYLWSKADLLSTAQLTELLRYLFTAYGESGQGMILIKTLTTKINVHIGSDFVPKSKSEVTTWLKDVFSKTDAEKIKAIFVTAAFNLYQHNVATASYIMNKIDLALEELGKTPEFNGLKEKPEANKTEKQA